MGVGCFILALSLTGGLTPVLTAEALAPGFFKEEDILPLLFHILILLAVTIGWCYILVKIFDAAYGAYRALHGERLKVRRLCPSGEMRIFLVPHAMVMDASSTVVLKRGDHLPKSFTRTGKAIVGGILNVSNVDRVMLNPNLAVIFKEEPTAKDSHMVDMVIADALWVSAGKPVTFVCEGSPSHTDSASLGR